MVRYHEWFQQLFRLFSVKKRGSKEQSNLLAKYVSSFHFVVHFRDQTGTVFRLLLIFV